jgi:hypothetical protein
VKLTWIEPIDAVSYTVKRSTVHGGPYAVVAGNVKISSFTDETAQRGQLYFYVVSARNTSGEGADAREIATCSGLPAPWKQKDIGQVKLPGKTNFDGQVFTIEGAGSSIGGTNDQLQFAYLPLEGDGTITVRHVPQVSSQHLQFGLLMRETTSPDSAQVVYLIQCGGSNGTKGWSTVLMARASAGANSTEAAINNIGAPTVTEGRLLEPCWLRLQRAQNTFTASFSLDGTQWTQIGTTIAALKKSLLVGIGTCSRLESPNASATTTVMMDHVSATGQTKPADGK